MLLTHFNLHVFSLDFKTPTKPLLVNPNKNCMSVKDLSSFAENYSIAIQALDPRQHFLVILQVLFVFSETLHRHIINMYIFNDLFSFTHDVNTT